MALAMVSITSSSQAILEGSLQQLSGSNRLSIARSGRTQMMPPKFTVKGQQQVSPEAETSRRAFLGVAAAGLASGSLVQAVLGEIRPPIIGGWEKIDPKDPRVQAIGEFAVTENNKEAERKFKFETVLDAYEQIFFSVGINFRLDIKTGSGNYEAYIHRDLDGKRQLESFKLLYT